MKTTFKIDGMDKTIKDLGRLGKVPQKHVSASSKKGMNTVLKNAKSNAPYDTGYLRKGIILKGEQARNKGKKVYDVIFDASMNEVFQKPNKEGKITGYYPVSQEYGFFAKNGRYIPGFRFIHDSLNKNAEKAGNIMVDTMKKKIDAEIKKVGLK